MNKTQKNKSTLMSKMIVQFSIIIIIMFLLSAYSLQSFKYFYRSFYSMLDQLVKDYTLSMQVDEIYQQINNYAHSGNKTYLNKYKAEVADLKNNLSSMKAGSTGDLYYKFRELYNMVETFDERSNLIVAEYGEGKSKIYIDQSTAELLKLNGYIQDEIMELLSWKLGDVQEYYKNFNGRIQYNENLIYVILGLITVLCVFFAYRFSKKLSVPIHQLVMHLQKVGKGELNIDKLKYESNDEISILFDSFNNMKIQIKNLINTITEKASLETKIKEQEINNLEMINLLNHSELRFLQSQINPHFLFNTINTISILADIESAPRTKKVLESMSDILRYNFKKLDEKVTLKEEFSIVENYLHIQKVRFGDRIKFKLNFDKSLKDYKIPSMILQPFVENAIVHGLEPKEGKGLLEISIQKTDAGVQIIIKDNGVGISNKKIEGFFLNVDKSEEKSQSGIGVRNVIRRLEIIFGKNIVEISSEVGKGTEVKIVLENLSI